MNTAKSLFVEIVLSYRHAAPRCNYAWLEGDNVIASIEHPAIADADADDAIRLLQLMPETAQLLSDMPKNLALNIATLEFFQYK